MSNLDVHFSSASSTHGTPWDLFNGLLLEFGMDLDVCALPENAKCARFFSPADDGLQQRWISSQAVWMNPPYGKEIVHWVKKAHLEAQRGTRVVSLLPARTDTKWWHTYIWCDVNHEPLPNVEVRLLRGRLRFLRPDGTQQAGAPFPSAVVIFHPAVAS